MASRYQHGAVAMGVALLALSLALSLHGCGGRGITFCDIVGGKFPEKLVATIFPQLDDATDGIMSEVVKYGEEKAVDFAKEYGEKVVMGAVATAGFATAGTSVVVTGAMGVSVMVGQMAVTKYVLPAMCERNGNLANGTLDSEVLKLMPMVNGSSLFPRHEEADEIAKVNGCTQYPSSAKFCKDLGHSHKVPLIFRNETVVSKRIDKIEETFERLKSKDSIKELFKLAPMCEDSLKDAMCMDALPSCELADSTACSIACRNVKRCFVSAFVTKDNDKKMEQSVELFTQECSDSCLFGGILEAIDWRVPPKLAIKIKEQILRSKNTLPESTLSFNSEGQCVDNSDGERLLLKDCNSQDKGEVFKGISIFLNAFAQISNTKTGKCWTVQESDRDALGVPINGAKVQLLECNEWDIYQWFVYDNSTTMIKVFAFQEKCVDFGEGTLLIWDCDVAKDNQQFHLYVLGVSKTSFRLNMPEFGFPGLLLSSSVLISGVAALVAFQRASVGGARVWGARNLFSVEALPMEEPLPLIADETSSS